MADLNEAESSGTFKLVGADNNGVENNFLNVDSLGRITVTTQEGEYFIACAETIVPANNPTDIFTISGVANMMIDVLNFRISGFRTTGTTTTFRCLKRSSLNSGAATVVPGISANGLSIAQAIVRRYTNNPTLGTERGLIRVDRIYVPPVSTGTGGTIHPVFEWNFPTPIRLDGANQVLAVNLASTSMAGGQLSISVDWRESNVS